MSHQRIARSFAVAPLVVLGMTFLVTLSGCPGGADLEHPELYPILVGTGGTSTGGTGTGGTGMAGTGTAPPQEPPVIPDCDLYTPTTGILSKSCAGLGCHRAVAKPPAGLILVPDTGLVGRLKDVPATHSDIYCPDQMPPDTCSSIPAACPAPGAALLVNSANPTESWMLKKLQGGTALPACGEQMPPAVFDPDQEQCVEKMIAAIAALPK